MRTLRRLLINKMVVALSAAVTAVAGLAPAAFGYVWSWGYNYMGSGVNQGEAGPSNYYYWETLLKNSGGMVQFGFKPVGYGCYKRVSGAYDWSGSPSKLGCGGYIYPYASWFSGATSYLKIYASA
jgi:hypothetical protein